MMKTLISLNETSNTPQRPWWEVRGALRAALIVVTAIAIGMCLERNLRAAVRASVVEPFMAAAQPLLAWDGWVPLGFAIGAGAFAAAALRRTRAPRPVRERRAVELAA